MVMIKVKGYEFDAVAAKDSFNRRALQYKNNIINTLRKVGLNSDDIDIELESYAFRNAPAEAIWYMDGHRLHYSHKSRSKYVDNLYVVFKVIEFEVNELLSEKKPLNEFIGEFSEDKDLEERRAKARETLGIDKDSLDLKEIDIKFKELARKHHPDMPDGDAHKFKEINNAHKILRRELQ